MTRRRLLMLVGGLILIAVLWLTITSLFRSDAKVKQVYSVTLRVEGAAGQYSLESSADGTLGSHSGSSVKTKLSSGQHTITITADGYAVSSVITLINRDGQIVNLRLEKLTGASKDLSKVANQGATNDNIRASNAKYFADNTWLVGIIGGVEKNFEAEVVVAKKVGDTWDTIDQGTFLDTDYLRAIGVPGDVISYVEEVQ